jgi:hypothetical protein
MKKIVMLLSIAVLASACAGMDYQHQQNMATNAVGWGLLGAGAGAAIASATHGDVGQAATIGTVAGAALGAANTPPPSPAYSPVVSQPQPPVPQYQPSAVYAPPPVVYASPPVVYAPAPMLYAPPIVYRDYYSPYCGLGGLNFIYYGGNDYHCNNGGGGYRHGYSGGYGHNGKGGGGYRYGYNGGYAHRGKGDGNYRHRHSGYSGGYGQNHKGGRYFRKGH